MLITGDQVQLQLANQSNRLFQDQIHAGKNQTWVRLNGELSPICSYADLETAFLLICVHFACVHGHPPYPQLSSSSLLRHTAYVSLLSQPLVAPQTPLGDNRMPG